jgi:hypothetical protein
MRNTFVHNQMHAVAVVGHSVVAMKIVSLFVNFYCLYKL